jgi:hypothetical protein
VSSGVGVGPGTDLADGFERSFGCPWPMYSAALRDEQRGRWTEARTAASAFRRIAAAAGTTWEEIARIATGACCDESRVAYLTGCTCSWSHFDIPKLSHFLSPADEGCPVHAVKA